MTVVLPRISPIATKHTITILLFISLSPFFDPTINIVIHKLAVFKTTYSALDYLRQYFIKIKYLLIVSNSLSFYVFYLFLSFRSQIPRAARTTAATALGQRGNSIPAAIMLTPQIKRPNWAQARTRSKMPITNDAGRFIILPPEKINYFISNNWPTAVFSGRGFLHYAARAWLYFYSALLFAICISSS
jgi:hypothetical protein